MNIIFFSMLEVVRARLVYLWEGSMKRKFDEHKNHQGHDLGRWKKVDRFVERDKIDKRQEKGLTFWVDWLVLVHSKRRNGKKKN